MRTGGAAAAEQEEKLREEREKQKARDRYIDSLKKIGVGQKQPVSSNANGLAAVALKKKVRSPRRVRVI